MQRERERREGMGKMTGGANGRRRGREDAEEEGEGTEGRGGKGRRYTVQGRARYSAVTMT